jgi:hypothetical protein
MDISEALLSEADGMDNVSIVGSAAPMHFDAEDNLISVLR